MARRITLFWKSHKEAEPLTEVSDIVCSPQRHGEEPNVKCELLNVSNLLGK